MPNRSASEREPEYQELMAGRSPHKGIIELFPATPELPQIAETGLGLAIPLRETTTNGEETKGISTPKSGLHERMSSLFHYLWH